MSTRLVLGTAQFGLNYGINNQRGKISQAEVFNILSYAFQHGVGTLDTAPAYEDSESLIGQFLKSSKDQFKILSKLSDDQTNVQKSFHQSLARLGLKKIYGFLVHHFEAFVARPKVWEELCVLKRMGLVKKVGFSLYHPQELEQLWERGIDADIVQIPFSILDQRFSDYLPEMKKRKTEVHVRSVFLQGLIFKNPQELEPHFGKIVSKLQILRALSKEHEIPLGSLALNFALLNPCIDEVIIGVDSLDNLKEGLEATQYQKTVKKFMSQLGNLKENDEQVIVPTNWNQS